MSYTNLVPPMKEYAQKFRLLDQVDFKIIKAMREHGFSNLSKLAGSTGIPKQTLSYHSRKLDKQDIVRFRALVDEPKLGLKSFIVIASTTIGKEDSSSRAMTCFPLWRYLAIVDGWKRGNYVRYVIPPDKERDLNTFMNDIKQRNIIQEFQILPTTTPNYPLLNLDFYGRKEGFPLFNWDRWVEDFDAFPEEDLVEPASYEKAKLDLYDLIILRCLEINAKTNQRKIAKEIARILKEKENARLISLVSRRTRDIVEHKGLIRGYRAYLFPNSIPSTMLLMYALTFANGASLRKFLAGLNHLPYNTGYEKILKRDEVIVRFIVPAFETPNVWKSTMELAERGHLKEAHLLLGDLEHKTWDNVEIYQMFKGETWNFSYGIAADALEKIVLQK
ncbi:MAG TPA: winged helix-turn-helix transcriptional regulator [Candidatus Acidoferrum sp.]|nr:winged helix-turn-helix transcriptional regulator [Candidatus Acidoferrum sp.]